MPADRRIEPEEIDRIVGAINLSLDSVEAIDESDDPAIAKLIAMKTRAAAASMYAGMQSGYRAEEYARMAEVLGRVEREMIRTVSTLEKQSQTHSAFVSGQQSIIAAIAATAGEHGDAIMRILSDMVAKDNDVNVSVTQSSSQDRN